MQYMEFSNSTIFISQKLDFDFSFLNGKKLLVVTDKTVFHQYFEGSPLQALFHQYAAVVQCVVLPCGEKAKELFYVEEIYQVLLQNQFARHDGVLALGGGVVSDVAGYVASTYMRGMEYYSMPTTLLGQVDSAYGGKCGVNFLGKKNIVGSFYQPSKIFVYTGFLQTLLPDALQDGYGEIIKYGFLYDMELVNSLEQCVKENDFTDIVQKSIVAKLAFVLGDEQDQGRRNMLNFGHTVGHALEALSGYTISHGKAVAAGMLYAIKMGIALNITPPDILGIAQKILEKYEFIVQYDFSSQQICDIIQSDKKVRGDCINMVLLAGIAKPVLQEIPMKTLQEVMKNI